MTKGFIYSKGRQGVLSRYTLRGDVAFAVIPGPGDVCALFLQGLHVPLCIIIVSHIINKQAFLFQPRNPPWGKC